MTQLAYSTSQLSKLLGTSAEVIRRNIRLGHIPSFSLGGTKKLVPAEWLEDRLKSAMHPHGEAAES